MGYERHADISRAKVKGPAKTDQAPPIRLSQPERPRTTAPETPDIQREARRMRDEWRRERYSRLRPN